MEEQVIKIVVTSYDGEELSLTTASDSGLPEYARLFKIILAWLTFDNQQIKQVIKEID